MKVKWFENKVITIFDFQGENSSLSTECLFDIEERQIIIVSVQLYPQCNSNSQAWFVLERQAIQKHFSSTQIHWCSASRVFSIYFGTIYEQCIVVTARIIADLVLVNRLESIMSNNSVICKKW